jgi:hypothetical protein
VGPSVTRLAPSDEPRNHQVHSTTYVEDFDNISVAKSRKKIFVRANLCNHENKIDDMSCVRIGSILLKIKEPKDHVRVPRAFQGCRIPSFRVLHGLKSTQ